MTTKRKCARILTSYYKPKPGGLCKRYIRAISALLDQGHIVHYLAVKEFPITDKKCNFHRFPWPSTHTDNLLFWLFYHLVAPVCLTYLGFRHNISHSFAFHPTYALVLQPLRVIKNIPITLFLRADSIENHKIKGTSKWIIFIDTIFEGLAIHKVRVFGVSDVLIKTVIVRHSIFKPAYYGTFRNDAFLSASEISTSPGRVLRLGSVGILEQRKNQSFLIQCMKKLDRNKVELLIFGVGPDEKKLKNMVSEAGIEKQVVFKGWVDSKDIWPCIDLLLMPSIHEGAPNAILEAIAVKMPFIASDIEEHKEILPKACLLPLNDEIKWVEYINVVLSKPQVTLEKLQSEIQSQSKKLFFDWDQEIVCLILSENLIS